MTDTVKYPQKFKVPFCTRKDFNEWEKENFGNIVSYIANFNPKTGEEEILEVSLIGGTKVIFHIFHDVKTMLLEKFSKKEEKLDPKSWGEYDY